MSSCKTHIVLFKSPRDVHQVAILNVQLGLGSTVVDWFWDASSVTFGHLLIDLSPRTDDRLRYCTNGGNFPSKLYVPENLKHLKILDGEHTKSLYFPSFTTFFPRMQNSVSKNLSKKFYPISKRVHRQLAAKKLVRNIKKPRAKVQRQNSRTVSIKNNLEAAKKSTFVAKSTIAHLNHLPLSFSFCLQQQQQPNHCHKTRITRNQTWANSHVTQRYGKKRNYPTAQGKCFLSNKKIFRVSLHQAIKFQHFDSGWNRDWCAVEGLCTVFEA